MKQLLVENISTKKAAYENAFDVYTRYLCDWAVNGEGGRLNEEMLKAKEVYLEALLMYKKFHEKELRL